MAPKGHLRGKYCRRRPGRVFSSWRQWPDKKHTKRCLCDIHMFAKYCDPYLPLRYAHVYKRWALRSSRFQQLLVLWCSFKYAGRQCRQMPTSSARSSTRARWCEEALLALALAFFLVGRMPLRKRTLPTLAFFRVKRMPTRKITLPTLALSSLGKCQCGRQRFRSLGLSASRPLRLSASTARWWYTAPVVREGVSCSASRVLPRQANSI